MDIDKFIMLLENHQWDCDSEGIKCSKCGIKKIEFDALKSRRGIMILSCRKVQDEYEYERYKEKRIKGEINSKETN